MIGERRAEYAGYRTRELFVEGSGPKLVLVHGFGHPAPCWRPVLTLCARVGQAAVAVDLPGFGAADPVPAGPRLPQLVRFLAAVVGAQGALTPVVLVGNSLGASVSVRLLDTVAGLPVAGLLALDVASDQWTPLAKMAMCGGGKPLIGLAGARLPAPLLHGAGAGLFAAKLLYGRSRRADPEMVRMLTEQLRSRAHRSEMARTGAQYKSEVAVVATVCGISCPTIVVHGSRDRLVTLAASRNLAAAVPGSRLVVLDGIGHCPQLDAPGRVLELAQQLAAAGAGRHSETG